MVKIAFWDNYLGERGTSVALYDYAFFNVSLLGNESIIIYNSSIPANNNAVVDKFKKQFKVFGVSAFNQVDSILQSESCDILYIIKGGTYDGKISNTTKTVVHCVFYAVKPHGSVYAAISPYISSYSPNMPVVPHMVYLPNNTEHMRKKLGIPDNAIVYGRHGGYDTFNLPFVHTAVYNVAKKCPNIYFLFMNTKPFCPTLPNIIHLPQIIDNTKKVQFINTCDAMLWGREDGETFGLAIGEFSIKNKPVLAMDIGYRAHVHYLKNRGIWYTKDTIESILTSFLTPENKEEIMKQDWNMYRDFSPEKVMKIFHDVFIRS